MANRFDNFNRANGAVVGSTPSDGGAGWVKNTNTGFPNTYQIVSNRAQSVDFSDQIVLEAGTGNVKVDVTAWGIAGSSYHGIILRAADQNNFIRCQYTSNQISIAKIVAGVTTTIAGPIADTYVAGNLLTAYVGADNVIRAYVNGVEKLSATDAAGSANTKHGLIATNSAQPSIFDDFAIYDLALLTTLPVTLTQHRRRKF